MGKSQRDKGKRGELKAVRYFRRVYPDAARNLSESRDGGTGVDLVNTGGLAVQVKNWQDYAPVSTLDEINAPGHFPVLVTMANRKPPRVVMNLSHFLKILEDVALAYEKPDVPPF